jgi:hypothetical protein
LHYNDTMIHLEITKSNNSDHLGEYQFHKDLIYIGSNLSADIYLPEKEILTNHLFIEVVEGKLLVHPSREADFFLVDGKRTTSVRYIKINQKISVGETEILIKSFSVSPMVSLREKLNEKTDQLINAKSDMLDLIAKLEEKARDDKQDVQ